MPDHFGILYLLRRDIIQCLGKNPNGRANLGVPAIWPGAMAILAGIDLLAKYLAGNDASGGVGPRFRCFVHKYFGPISAGDEETVYQLRNALLHSFGLYSERLSKKGVVTKFRFVLSFQITVKGSPLVMDLGHDSYMIDVAELHNRFEAGVCAFQADVDRDAALQMNFEKMFVKYGSIHIG